MAEQTEVRESQQEDGIGTDSENRAIRVVASLKELQQEFNQIRTALELEKAISRDVSSFMEDFLRQVGTSYHLDPALFPRLGSSVREVILTPQCIFFLTYNDGLTVARTVNQISPDSLMKVLEEILPDIKMHFKERRERIASRSVGLYRVASELKEMSANQKTAPQGQAPSPGTVPVTSSLSAKI